jgi:hypothetical protein
MVEMNYVAVVVAAVAAFVATFVWYLVFGNELGKVSTAIAEQKPAAWKMVVAVGQNLVLATVLAYIIERTGAEGWLDTAWIGVVLWIGLSAMQWVGSMLWEKVPLKMAVIHAGDWLMKLVLISVIVGVRG